MHSNQCGRYTVLSAPGTTSSSLTALGGLYPWTPNTSVGDVCCGCCSIHSLSQVSSATVCNRGQAYRRSTPRLFAYSTASSRHTQKCSPPRPVMNAACSEGNTNPPRDTTLSSTRYITGGNVCSTSAHTERGTLSSVMLDRCVHRPLRRMCFFWRSPDLATAPATPPPRARSALRRPG